MLLLLLLLLPLRWRALPAAAAAQLAGILLALVSSCRCSGSDAPTLLLLLIPLASLCRLPHLTQLAQRLLLFRRCGELLAAGNVSARAIVLLLSPPPPLLLLLLLLLL